MRAHWRFIACISMGRCWMLVPYSFSAWIAACVPPQRGTVPLLGLPPFARERIVNPIWPAVSPTSEVGESMVAPHLEVSELSTTPQFTPFSSPSFVVME